MQQFGLENRIRLIKPNRNLSVKKLIKNHLQANIPADKIRPYRGFKNRFIMWHDLMGHLVLISSLSVLENPQHRGISNIIGQRNNLLELAIANMYLYSSDRYTGDLSFRDSLKLSFDDCLRDLLLYSRSQLINYLPMDKDNHEADVSLTPILVMYKKAPQLLEEYISSINLDVLVLEIEKRYEAFGKLMMKKYPKNLIMISKLTPFQAMQEVQDALLDRRQSLLDSEMVYDLVNRLTTKELIDAGVLTQDVFPHWKILSEQ